MDSITRLLQRIDKLLEKIFNGGTIVPAINAVEDDVEASNALLTTIDTVLDNIKLDTDTIIDNVTSKIERIKGSANYTRTLAYYTTTDNVTSIVHTGTTLIGAETITETIAYIDAAGGDFRINTITYS